MKRTLVSAAALASALVMVTSTNATAATTSGTGWRIMGHVTHLDETYWSFQYYDQYTMDNMDWFIKKTAAEITEHTGLKIHVHTSFVNPNDEACPGYTKYGGHRLIIRLDPSKDRSGAYPCGLSGAVHSARATFSGSDWINRESYGSHGVYRKNVTSHELGHAMGLGHPDWTGTEHDSTLCDLDGINPLMCGSKWGGYWWWDMAHVYPDYDVKGFKALVANRP